MAVKQIPPSGDLITSREARIAEARKFNLLSDIFMSVALRDLAACQHVLRIVMGVPDLVVKSVRTQYVISNFAHGAQMDVVAESGSKKIYNIEIQRRDTDDHARRSRFYGSLLDSEMLDKGASYDTLADVYIIYISETDIWQAGKTLYSVEKQLKEAGIAYDDGVHVVYVNAEIDDGSELAKLMQYFKSADPEDMSQGALSERVRALKYEKGGDADMCEVSDRIYQAGVQFGLEEGRAEGRAEGRREGVRALIAVCRELAMTREHTRKRIMAGFGLSQEAAAQYVELYWLEELGAEG